MLGCERLDGEHQAELVGGDGSAEVTEFTLDFLSGGETREATAVFATDPLTGELTIGRSDQCQVRVEGDTIQTTTLSEIAGELDLSIATCHAITAVLVARGYLLREPAGKTFTLGPAVVASIV